MKDSPESGGEFTSLDQSEFCGLIYDSGRYKEQDFLGGPGNGRPAEKIADKRQIAQTGHLVAGIGFVVDKNTANDRGPAIADQNPA